MNNHPSPNSHDQIHHSPIENSEVSNEKENNRKSTLPNHQFAQKYAPYPLQDQSFQRAPLNLHKMANRVDRSIQKEIRKKIREVLPGPDPFMGSLEGLNETFESITCKDVEEAPIEVLDMDSPVENWLNWKNVEESENDRVQWWNRSREKEIDELRDTVFECYMKWKKKWIDPSIDNEGVERIDNPLRPKPYVHQPQNSFKQPSETKMRSTDRIKKEESKLHNRNNKTSLSKTATNKKNERRERNTQKATVPGPRLTVDNIREYLCMIAPVKEVEREIACAAEQKNRKMMMVADCKFKIQ